MWSPLERGKLATSLQGSPPDHELPREYSLKKSHRLEIAMTGDE